MRKQPTGRLPEDADGWNQAFVGAVREVKDRFRDSPDLPALLRIVSEKLYGKEIHWALELIQNAEDEGARHIVFVISEDEVLVGNDGAAFTADGVWGICSAGQSPKKNKIGFFGIGFKSVFLISDRPEIRSGPYAFLIEDKIYPTPLTVTRRRSRGAHFRLPIKEGEKHRMAAMVDQLTQPEFLHLLLTLSSLQTIHVVDRIHGRRGRFYRRVTRTSTHWDECVVGGSWANCEEQAWRRYQARSEPIPGGLLRDGREFQPGERSRIVVARPIDHQPTEPHIHCFLPLDVVSELGWLLQADFDPTPGRERLHENDWNRWLLVQVGSALADAIKADAYEGNQPWAHIALNEEVKAPLQRIAYEHMLARLKQERFLRSRSGWRTPDRVAWPLYPGVSDVVRESDLALVAGGGPSYITKALFDPAGSADSARARTLLAQLGAAAIGCTVTLRLLSVNRSRTGLDTRGSDWWLNCLYLFAAYGPDQQSELAKQRCIPTTSGVVAPSPHVAEDGYMVAFSRSDVLADLETYFGPSQVFIVDSNLSTSRRKREIDSAAARQKVHEMLVGEHFRVATEAGPYHVVRNLVIPRMAAARSIGKLTNPQPERLWRMVEYVRQKWPSFISDYRRWRTQTATEADVADWLSGQFVVVAKRYEGRRWRRCALPVGDCYLPAGMLGEDGMDVVLRGREGLAVLDEIHARPVGAPGKSRERRSRPTITTKIAADFFRLLSVHVGPRVSAAGGDPTPLGPVNTYPRTSGGLARQQPLSCSKPAVLGSKDPGV